jgi:hypothetical protein
MTAGAIPITGNFSGTTTDSMNVQGIPMFGDFDGLRVSGTFAFDTMAGGAASVTILVPDKPIEVSSMLSVSFGRDALFDLISLDDPTANVGSPVTAFARFQAPAGTLPLLEDPSGRLIGLDAARFEPSRFDLGHVIFRFAQRRGPIAFVALERLSFQGPTAPISLPGSLLLLVLGLPLCLISVLTRSGAKPSPRKARSTRGQVHPRIEQGSQARARCSSG